MIGVHSWHPGVPGCLYERGVRCLSFVREWFGSDRMYRLGHKSTSKCLVSAAASPRFAHTTLTTDTSLKQLPFLTEFNGKAAIFPVKYSED